MVKLYTGKPAIIWGSLYFICFGASSMIIAKAAFDLQLQFISGPSVFALTLIALVLSLLEQKIHRGS